MRALTPLGHRETTLDNRVVVYALKRSSKARCVRLEIREGEGLTVIVPRLYDLAGLDQLIRRRTSWILSKLDRETRLGSDRAQELLRNGESVPYLGRELRVIMTRGEGNKYHMRAMKDQLLITTPSQPDNCDDLLEMWFRRKAKKFLKERVELLACKLGVPHGRVIIRGQKTRWASCSVKADLSFNWRLMMAPITVIDYVIIHELSHLKEMNHTTRFWKLVAQRCPTWKENRRWLKENGPQLSAIPVKFTQF